MDNKVTAQQLWKQIKWSNQNPDGSITISAERVKGIDEAVKRETDNVKVEAK